MLSVLFVDPMGQYWHAWPEVEYRPAGQLAHVVELGDDVCPAGQLVHVPAPLDEYVFCPTISALTFLATACREAESRAYGRTDCARGSAVAGVGARGAGGALPAVVVVAVRPS